MIQINWEYCQGNSDIILASGISILLTSKKLSFDDGFSKLHGNYLVSDSSNKWNYIGEAKIVSARIKRHSREKTSTFYKNYKRLEKQFKSLPQNLNINQFQIQTISTFIGRKEVEEFGIVNIPANLNKFQKGKRDIFAGGREKELWSSVQAEFKNLLKQGEQAVLKSNSYPWFEAEIANQAGLYWVEHPKHDLIYIGESSNVFDRYKTHSGATYFSALRRHIGENILGFKLQTRKGKKRYFNTDEDKKITLFLKQCSIKSLAISFGRYELEEYLIRKHKPLLNRKENK